MTIAFEGEVEHGDSLGNTGVIKEGGIQWMTAGRGIVHQEYHSRAFAARGGVFSMAQIWVNLPAEHKMTPPRYQDIQAPRVPVVPFPGRPEEDGQVRVYAGSFAGVTGPADTFTPVEVLDLTLENTDTPYEVPIPDGHNTMVCVRKGGAVVDGTALAQFRLAMLTEDGGAFSVRATAPGTQLLVLAGEPIAESIAARGPFVMNTQEELSAAVSDYQSGKLGR